MRILKRFIIAGFHYGPGDEVFLHKNAALTDVSLATLVEPGFIDLKASPWTPAELEAQRVKDDKAARAAEAKDKPKAAPIVPVSPSTVDSPLTL